MRTLRGLCVFALFASICGCGAPTAESTVTGVVKLDGQVLSNAKVEFTPVSSGVSSVGFTDINGRYRLLQSANLEGADPGTYLVAISKTEERPVPGAQEGETFDVNVVPPEFNTASTLQKDVVSGANTFDFELSSTGSKK